MLCLGPGECQFLHFSYPPTVLFFTYPFGLLPYMTAFAVWIVATIVLYLVAVYAIIPRPAAVIAALTPMAVPVNVLFGHNGFLTAGLIGLSLVFVERRPWLSGILFRAADLQTPLRQFSSRLRCWLRRLAYVLAAPRR